jgi:hypothetical protein
MKNKLTLEDLVQLKKAYNRIIPKPHSSICIVCGRPTGYLIYVEIEGQNYPVGSKCAKRIPKQYILPEYYNY